MVIDGNGNGNGIIMEWVGYPFCDSNGNGIKNTHVIDFAIAVAIATDTPQLNSHDDAVAVAITQCERTFSINT